MHAVRLSCTQWVLPLHWDIASAGLRYSDFDKLKALFRSRIHITMVISLFAANRQQWANKNLFPFPNGRKKKSNRKNIIKKYELDNVNTMNNTGNMSTPRHSLRIPCMQRYRLQIIYSPAHHNHTTAVAVAAASQITSHLLK